MARERVPDAEALDRDDPEVEGFLANLFPAEDFEPEDFEASFLAAAVFEPEALEADDRDDFAAVFEAADRDDFVALFDDLADGFEAADDRELVVRVLLERRREERPFPRSAAGISSRATPFVSDVICPSRNLAIRSSSRRIPRAS